MWSFRDPDWLSRLLLKHCQECWKVSPVTSMLWPGSDTQTSPHNLLARINHMAPSKHTGSGSTTLPLTQAESGKHLALALDHLSRDPSLCSACALLILEFHFPLDFQQRKVDEVGRCCKTWQITRKSSLNQCPAPCHVFHITKPTFRAQLPPRELLKHNDLPSFKEAKMLVKPRAGRGHRCHLTQSCHLRDENGRFSWGHLGRGRTGTQLS